MTGGARMGFLGRIVRAKRDEITARKRIVAQADLERRAEGFTPRDFRRAISGGGRIIAEIKKKSPSVARFPRSETPEALAAVYEANGASAVSVVTDARNFGTSLDDAERIRRAVSLPVLVKEFVIDPYQVFDARAHGADALLLIVRILTGPQLAELLGQVHDLGMRALVEVHGVDEVGAALEAGVEIIGINNRNLDTMSVTLETTRELIGTVRRASPGATIISESGIHTPEQIAELSALGADAFLVGGALLESDDPGARLRTLAGTFIDESTAGKAKRKERSDA